MRDWMKVIVREAEGLAGGAAAPVAAPDAGSVLFPNDQKPADAPVVDPAVAAPAAGDWKEYEPDPAKSAEENAAAKAEHDKAKPAVDDAAAKVPEDGKYDLKMPDGVELDAELATALGPEFAELKLTNGQAQKLVDKYIEIQQSRASKQGETFAQTVAGWADTAKKDPEIGGDKWDASVMQATRFINKVGTPALKEYLNASGGGNHPELIRAFSKAGAMIAEDIPATGGAGGKGQPVDPAYVIFANDAPKG